MCREKDFLLRQKLAGMVGKNVMIRVGNHGALNKVRLNAVDNSKVGVCYSNSENDIPMTYELSLIEEVFLA